MSDSSSIPLHIGIIMDGNGRWATQRGLPRSVGHQKGAEALRGVVEASANLGVRSLTLFGFSTENWSRPRAEVLILMKLAEQYLSKEVENLHKEGVRFQVIGDRKRLPQSLQNLIQNAEHLTENNQRFTLNIALSYSGQWDILNAVNTLISTSSVGNKAITTDDLEPFLSLYGQPKVDLIIRTSGEQRISNFLLWQAAYSELYFTEVYWPGFDDVELQKAVTEYQKRQRRFGNLA